MFQGFLYRQNSKSLEYMMIVVVLLNLKFEMWYLYTYKKYMDVTLQQCGLNVAPMVLQLAHESIREGFTNKISV